MPNFTPRPLALPPPPRWLWKSGRTRPGGAVPWNVCAVNTDPVGLAWEPDKTVILALHPGLYELAFAFFSADPKPIVQVGEGVGQVAGVLGQTGRWSRRMGRQAGEGNLWTVATAGGAEAAAAGSKGCSR